MKFFTLAVCFFFTCILVSVCFQKSYFFAPRPESSEFEAPEGAIEKTIKLKNTILCKKDNPPLKKIYKNVFFLIGQLMNVLMMVTGPLKKLKSNFPKNMFFFCLLSKNGCSTFHRILSQNTKFEYKIFHFFYINTILISSHQLFLLSR